MSDPENQGARALRSIAGKILAGAKLSPSERRFWRQPLRDLRRLVERDYSHALREHVRRSEVKALVASARSFWPRLNRAKLALPSAANFASISKRLELNLSIRECRERDGMALRGFYVRSIDQVARDHRRGGLIYLNTAHHPAAVGATFCHEVGHHLALGILPRSDDRAVHFFFDAAYSSHLDDPVELAADVLVAIAAYPGPVARHMFAGEMASDLGGNIGAILNYLKSGWGIDFELPRQPQHHLIYLVGMVHYAKLRRALLTEYRI
jgi:hypothetical protein